MAEESTTPELARLVHGFGDALNAQNFDALLGFYAPDAVVSSGVFGSHEGQAAIRGFYEDWIGGFGHFENEFEEVRDLGAA